MNFADRLHNSIEKRKSFLVAGLDPQFESLPRYLQKQAAAHPDNAAALEWGLSNFCISALEALSDCVAAVKPNIAFYEQYGLGGIKAFMAVCAAARRLDLPIIADGKRGDIGSTAQAYSRAFLGQSAGPHGAGPAAAVARPGRSSPPRGGAAGR